MRIQVFVRTVVLVGLSALTFPATARAGSIRLDTSFQGVAGLRIVLNDQTFGLSGVGSVSMSQANGLGDLDTVLSFEAYCVDFFTEAFFPEPGLPIPPETYDATGDVMSTWFATSALNTAAAQQRASWLYNTYATTFDAVDTAEGQVQRSALQMAIWNELYDGDLNISIGSTRITGDGHGVTVIAQDFLNGLGNASTSSVSSAEAAWLQLAFTRPATGTEPALTTDAQDFIGPLTPATPVPEPAAGMLLGMGIASLAAFRSRKSFLRRS